MDFMNSSIVYATLIRVYCATVLLTKNLLSRCVAQLCCTKKLPVYEGCGHYAKLPFDQMPLRQIRYSQILVRKMILAKSNYDKFNYSKCDCAKCVNKK